MSNKNKQSNHAPDCECGMIGCASFQPVYTVKLVLEYPEPVEGRESDTTCSFSFDKKDEAISFITELESVGERLSDTWAANRAEVSN